MTERMTGLPSNVIGFTASGEASLKRRRCIDPLRITGSSATWVRRRPPSACQSMSAEKGTGTTVIPGYATLPSPPINKHGEPISYDFWKDLGFEGQHLGNFSQAFTHLGLISAAHNLNKQLNDTRNKNVDSPYKGFPGEPDE